MATEIIMPQMGFDMKQGTVVRWLKQEGDVVAKGDVVAEIETDKAVVEVEAFGSGVLRKIAIEQGLTVPVGQVIGVIGTVEETIPEVVLLETARADDPSAKTAPAGTAQSRETPATPGDEPGAASRAKRDDKVMPGGERLRASPLARREAERLGLDIGIVKGTGPGGRITRDDVVRHGQASGGKSDTPEDVPTQPGGVVALSTMRRAIAKNMTRSKQEIPHFYVTVEVDMTEAVRLRADLNEVVDSKEHISVNDMVIYACARSIPDYRVFNSLFIEAGVRTRQEINIGIAVALEDGLVAPAILDADKKSLLEIAQAARHLADRARSGSLSAAEYSGGTFNITNLGMLDVDSFSAIIAPGQSAVLAVAAVKTAMVVRNGEPTVGSVMKMTLSVDHRVADGAQAAQFLQAVRMRLEKPVRLMI